jgi:thioredoxin reductase (NADPH)
VAATREPQSAPDTRLVRPRLSDDQVATLQQYGTVEPTTVGQVLFAAGDPSYDLIVLLEGTVEVSVMHDSKPRPIAVAGPRDFLAELNLLTGQRVYFTGVVTEAGSIMRVPRERVGEVIDRHGDLGAFLLQEMFRRRQMFFQSRAGVQIVGSRYAQDTQRLREFATRNRLAHAWIDLDSDPAAAALLDSAGVHPGDTPVVLFEGTGVLRNPSNTQFARAAGITGGPAWGQTYDLVVIGAGPGGLAAAVYGASEGLTTAAADAVAAGGQASTTSRIENYLGFPAGVSGAEFGERALLQAVRFGTQMFVPHRAVGLTRPDGHYLIALEDGTQLAGKSVIVATGVSYRRLDAPGIERFEGLGVFYSPLHPVRDVEPDETVVIVGGGNSAGQAAVALADAGHQVRLAVRSRGLATSMSTYLLDRITRDERIFVHVETVVSELHGARHLESVVLRGRGSAKLTTVQTHYLLAMIGAAPHTEWLPPELARDERGFILTGDAVPPAFRHSHEWSALGRAPYLYETSLPGAFAVGDVRAGSVKRVAAAAGEGSMAVRLVQQHLGLVPA